MKQLLICLCKNDTDVIASAKKYLEAHDCFKYFGGRVSGIGGTLKTISDLGRIIVTAHGSKTEIGEALKNFIDVTAKEFADILNTAKFTGDVYFDVCSGYKFGTNVKSELTCGAIIYGAKGETDMDIDIDSCVICP